MRKWIAFLQQDISVLGKHRQKRLPLASQRKVIDLFTNLFSSGFHLAEIVDFLTRSRLLPATYTDVMQDGLLSGKSFSGILSDLRFSDSIVTQLSLAERHGNTLLSLTKLQDYLSHLTKVKKRLVEVATYPLILLTFLIVIMLGLKHYLLPQMQDDSLATQAIQHLPTIFFGFMAFLALLALGLRSWFNKTTKILAYTKLAKLPFLGTLIRTYLTAYYAREWGSLISQGLELPQILSLMQEQPSQLFRELGQDMGKALSNGNSFHEQIAHYSFFKKELSLIIEYGQVKAKLGQELSIYADECWEEFFATINARMQLIQPLIFLFVALMIVLVYAAMLLPIYNNMEVSL